MKAFYEKLGCQFEKFQVSKGAGGFRCEWSDFEMKLTQVNATQPARSPLIQLSFTVPQIEHIFEKIKIDFEHLIMMEPFHSKEGLLVMLLNDPQGNSVEVISEHSGSLRDPL
jgi:hypothetical protein